MCWTRPLEGEADAAAAAAAATDEERGVEAREGTRRGAGDEEEEEAEEGGAIEWTIVGDDDGEDRRRRCEGSGAALGTSLPGNGQAPVATLARRGVGLSLRAICVFFSERGRRERGRDELRK